MTSESEEVSMEEVLGKGGRRAAAENTQRVRTAREVRVVSWPALSYGAGLFCKKLTAISCQLLA